MSLNKVMLIGRLGQDPEIRQAGSGQCCNFTLATDESYTDRNGQKVEQTEWHKIVVWNNQADACSKFLRKGSQCYVEGKIQTRKYQDKNGQDRYTTEIKADRVQFLDKKEDGGNSNGGNNRSQQRRQATRQAAPAPSEQAMDDLPF